MFVCKEIMQILCHSATGIVISHFTQGPKLPAVLRNQQRCVFAARNHSDSALESPLSNQGTIVSPPKQFCQQTAEGTLKQRLHHCLPRSPKRALSNNCQLKICIICIICIKMQNSLSNQRPKYARICSTKYAENMQNMHKRNLQNICHCSVLYVTICKSQICIYMQISLCKNLQKYAKICKTEHTPICISKICIKC